MHIFVMDVYTCIVVDFLLTANFLQTATSAKSPNGSTGRRVSELDVFGYCNYYSMYKPHLFAQNLDSESEAQVIY